MNELLGLSRYTYYFGERVQKINAAKLPARHPSHVWTPGMTAWNGLCSVINGSLMNRRLAGDGLRLSMAAGKIIVNARVGNVHEFMRRRVEGDELGAQDVRLRGTAKAAGVGSRILVDDHVHGVVLEDWPGGPPRVKWIVDAAGHQTKEGFLPMAIVASPQELGDMGIDYTMERNVFPDLGVFFAAGTRQNLASRISDLDRQIGGDVLPHDDLSEHYAVA